MSSDAIVVLKADHKQLQELGVKLERARKEAPRSPAQPSALKKTVDAVMA
ncbi:MAG TPA: hypothetical protein VGS06_15770 [Streptosporangiaceae bacterium]|nr:hypothetical protein [Streptosporangiaceae bacterium]